MDGLCDRRSSAKFLRKFGFPAPLQFHTRIRIDDELVVDVGEKRPEYSLLLMEALLW